MLIAQIPLILSPPIPIMTSPLDSVKCLHRADEYKSLLVGHHWHIHVQEDNVTYEFIFAFPAVFPMSCLSYLDGLWDGR